MHATIYHNPRCSKSRETYALLEQHGVEIGTIHYLETPPDAATLHHLLQLLDMSDARQLMRHKEAEYSELSLDQPELSQEALIAAMVAHPKLIERPIVVVGERAVIGRPPEQVLALLVE